MNRKLFPALLAILLVTSLTFAQGLNTREKLREASVTVTAGGSQGSGTVFIHKYGKHREIFVLTAAHVIKNRLAKKKVKLPGVELFVRPDGEFDFKQATKEVEYFKKIQVIKYQYKGVKRVAKIPVLVEVVKYSPAWDLALLRVKESRHLFKHSGIAWIDSSTNPRIGTKIIHVGSIHGMRLPHTVLEGTIAGTDRDIPYIPFEVNNTYDQLSFPVEPGCSGGGVFTRDRKLIGVLVRKYLHTGFMVPIRDVRTWMEREKVYWVINRRLKKPKVKDLHKIPMFDKVRLH